MSLYPDITVARLKPYHVQQWIDGLDIKQTSKRNCVRAIKRAMRWSKKQGYIEVNPIAEMEAPSSERREYVIDEEEFKRILEAIPSPEFRDLVLVSWETGCRPQESLREEARHLDIKNRRWVFPVSEAKGKKKIRVVYLTEKAAAISFRLAEKYPEGKLFRNSKAFHGKAFQFNVHGGECE